MSTTTYQATATREGRWWLIAVPSVGGVTQARSLAEAPLMARELVAVTLDVPLDDVEVDVSVVSVDGIDVVGEVEAIEQARRDAARLEREAAEKAGRLASTLAEKGVTLRDVGTALGVTHQRAHQLVQAARR